MSFTAEFVGGPLDGVASRVSNPPLPVDRLWGFRCLGGTCRLVRLLEAEDLRDAARAECREQRCHVFSGDPMAFGLSGSRIYHRTGAKKNVHQYELSDGVLAPGAAIYREPAAVDS